MQAFCNKCGQELPSNAALCGLCGEPQRNQEAPQYAQPQQYQPQTQQYQQPQPQQYQPQVQQFQPSQPQQYQPQTQQYQQPQPQQHQHRALQSEFHQSQYEGYAPAAAQPTKGFNKKLIGIIAGAVAVVIILVVVIAVFAGNESPEEVAEKYIYADLNFDYETMQKYRATDLDISYSFIAMLSPEPVSEAEIRRRVETELPRLRADNIERMKNEFGSDYKITVTAITTSYVSRTEMRDKVYAFLSVQIGHIAMTNFVPFELYEGYVPSLIERHMPPLEEIEEMCIVGARRTVEGSKKRDSWIQEVLCVKIGGKWKVL